MNSQNSKFKNSSKSNPHFRPSVRSTDFNNQNNSSSQNNQSSAEEEIQTDSTKTNSNLDSNQNSFQDAKQTENNVSGIENKSNSDLNNSLIEENNLLKIQIENLQKEILDWQDKAVRAFADIQNITRQHDLDISQAKKSTKKSIVITIINLINTLNLSFTYLPENLDPKMQQFVNALKLSLSQVVESFKHQGVEILIPESGSSFNAEFMNILNSDQIPDSENIVVKNVVGVGLKIDNQVIQPVSIMV